jgi:hypothetical protein
VILGRVKARLQSFFEMLVNKRSLSTEKKLIIEKANRNFILFFSLTCPHKNSKTICACKENTYLIV